MRCRGLIRGLGFVCLGSFGAVGVWSQTIPTECAPPPFSTFQIDPTCCTGKNCGLDPQFDDFDCAVVNVAGLECWDGDGDSCTSVPGFALADAGVSLCSDFGTRGSVAGQLLNGVGGYNLWSGIRKTAKPGIVTEHEEAQASADSGSSDEGDESGGEEEGGPGSSFFSEMTTSVEVDDWEYRGPNNPVVSGVTPGVAGTTPGLRVSWLRQSEGGRLFGIAGSYQDSDPDVGQSSQLLNLNVNVGHTLGTTWNWSASGTYSDFGGFLDQTFLGASGQIGFAKYATNGVVLSGGAIYQFLSADSLPEDLQSLGYGVALGFPLGRRLTLDFEGYAVSVTQGEVLDDSFYTLGGTFSIYVTRRFAATFGYRVLGGIDEFDSEILTFGASTRWP